ncbi:MAG TPA: type 2 lanthipeptide synthetase LanM family protein [Aggregatilineales bacterium]|nr:type 2 lanthipeptide synthetase LanM family protein [Aggregatilineales bacterium]
MRVEAEILDEIVERASSLQDRLSGALVPRDPVDETAAEIESRLQQWCQNVTRGDWDRFKNRLLWDGIDLEAVRPLLGSVRVKDGQFRPRWAHTLGEVLAGLGSGLSGEDRCLDKNAPIPFEEVWLPFVRLARRSVQTRSGSNGQLLSDEAQATQERELLSSLSQIGSQALLVEFMTFQATAQPWGLLKFMNQPTAADRPAEKITTQLYSEFVRNTLDGGLAGVLREYSVLGRLAATATDFWIDATSEFIDRLAADLPDLQQRFGSDLGRVVSLTADLSDPHRNGRSVIALRFESGFQLVYKPRDLSIEAAFNRFLGWLNDQGVTPAFKALKVLARPTHGWIEFVEHSPCKTEDEARAYYRRAGMLVCLIYLLHGSDCHGGNLIASGPHPVIVDLEVLLDPIVAYEGHQEGMDSAQVLAVQQFKTSVLTSALLPCWEQGSDGKGYDISALGSMPIDSGVLMPGWHYINTDQMARFKTEQPLPENKAVAYLDHVALSPDDYADDIVAGFRQMYGFFQERQQSLQEPDGPLAMFRHVRGRFVFRNTSLYTQLRQYGFDPKYMRDGVDRSIHLDRASWVFLLSNDKSRYWPLLHEELHALEQMDIPIFNLYTDGNALISSADPILVPGAFTESGYSLVLSTLNHLSQADMELQSGFIRAALLTRTLGGADAHPEIQPVMPDLGKIAPLSRDQLVEEAVSIADKLVKTAIRSDTSITWIMLEYSAEIERYGLRPLGPSLYSGLAGIALFFGALGKVTGESTYRDLAVATMRDVRADLAQAGPGRLAIFGSRVGLGGAFGIGGIVYVMARLSQFLDDEKLLAEARRACALVTPQLIADDRHLDVVSGSAGLILGLLALYDRLPDPALLDQAIVCGRHLLGRRTPGDPGVRAWITLNEAALTGFSHGAAGIAYALECLYQRAPDPLFLEAASEAGAYERSVFSPDAGNWPDFRYPSSQGPVFTTSWCHGAPGIALARLTRLKWIDSADTRRDVEIGLKTTRQAALEINDVDHLCCGTLGRVETLFKADQILARPDLAKAAIRLASRVVAMAHDRGAYLLLGTLSREIHNPGFFQGLSGIGYELLRLAYPDTLPSVLLWE